MGSNKSKSKSKPQSSSLESGVKKRRRWLRWGKWLAIVYGVYVVFGFFGVGPLLEWQLRKQLPEYTHRQAGVSNVFFNPLALSLQVKGLSLTETNGEVFASLAEFYVNFQASSLFRLALCIDELRLRQPFGNVILHEDGRFNFENLIAAKGDDSEEAKEASEEEGGGKVIPILLRHLHVIEGEVDVADLTRDLPLHAEMRPINISLTNLTTRTDGRTPYEIEVRSDTFDRISWSGFLQVDPFLMTGEFDFEGGKLGRSTPVVREFARVEVADGHVDLRIDYRVAVGAQGLEASVTNGLVSLRDLQVREFGTEEVVLRIGGLEVGPIRASLQEREVHVGAVSLTGLYKVVRIEGDGGINWLSLISPSTNEGEAESSSPEPAAATNAVVSVEVAEAPTNAPPWVLAVDELLLNQSVFVFSDLSRAEEFHTSIGPVRVQVRNVSNRPGQEIPYEFDLATEAGEFVRGQGSVWLLPSVSATGLVQVGSVLLPKYAPYYDEFWRGQLADGRVDVRVNYGVALATNGPTGSLRDTGLTVRDLEIRSDDPEETLFSLSEFSVENVQANLDEETAEVGRVFATGGRVGARRNDDGSLNWLRLLPETAAVSGETGESAEADGGASGGTAQESVKAGDDADSVMPVWSVLVKEIALEDFSVDLEDRLPETPVQFGVSDFALSVRDLTLEGRDPMAVELSMTLGDRGRLQVGGEVTQQPVRADLEIDLSEFSLSPFAPYAQSQVRLALPSARLHTLGRVHFSAAETDRAEPRVTFQGDVGLTEFSVADLTHLEEMVGWDRLAVKGIDAAVPVEELNVEEIRLDGFRTSLVVAENGEMNMMTVLPGEGPAGADAEGEQNRGEEAQARGNPEPVLEAAEVSGGDGTGAASLPTIHLGGFVLDKASLKFVDQTVDPACTFVVEEISGRLANVTTRSDGQAEVDLHGRVGLDAPFLVQGRIMQALATNRAVQMSVVFTNTDLTAFSPYMAKYAGYPMKNGRLNMDLAYDIDGEALQAKNEFQLAKLTLGARNDSTNATTLPVKLAVALLKDRRGNIEVDVPLSGKINDPQFSVGPIIWNTVMNLIAKAATSPFSLLGAALGGGEGESGEELSFVAFSAGRATIPEDQAKKLDRLIDALYERPAIHLEMSGQLELTTDRSALAELKLEETIAALRESYGTNTTNGINTTNQADSTDEIRFARPQSEAGWLALHFLGAALTNRSLLPETNLVAVLRGEPVEVAGVSGTQEAEEGAPRIVGSRDGQRRHFFSGDKGASLLMAKRRSAQEVMEEAPEAFGEQDGSGGLPEALALARDLGLTDEAMRMRLLETVEVTEQDLRGLLEKRALAVRDYVSRSQRISPERLQVKSWPEDTPLESKQSRVELSLF